MALTLGSAIAAPTSRSPFLGFETVVAHLQLESRKRLVDVTRELRQGHEEEQHADDEQPSGAPETRTTGPTALCKMLTRSTMSSPRTDARNSMLACHSVRSRPPLLARG